MLNKKVMWLTAFLLCIQTGLSYSINSDPNLFLNEQVNYDLLPDEKGYKAIFDLEITAKEDEANAQESFIQGLQNTRSGNRKKALRDMLRAETLFKRTLKADENSIIALNGLAGIALFHKQPELASQWVERSLVIEPLNNKTWLIKAEIALANNNTQQAKEIYQQVLKRDNKMVLAHMAIAKLDVANNELGSAKKQLKEILRLDDQFILAYFQLATIEYKNNNLAAAEKHLKQAYQKTKGNKKAEEGVIKRIVLWYSENKQFQNLLTFIETPARKYPDNIYLQTVLAKAQLLNGNNQDAEKTLRKIISADKKIVLSRLLLARLIAGDPQNKEEVIKLLDEAIFLMPTYPDVRIIKVNYLISQQDYSGAKEQINKIDQLFSKPEIVAELQGNLFLARKEQEQALISYQQAYQLQNSPKLLIRIVTLMEEQRQITAAINFLIPALEKQPDNIAFHYKIAILYRSQNEIKLAISHYQKILDIIPKNVLVLNNLAWLYALDNNPEALVMAKKAYNLSDAEPIIADTYGYILMQQGEMAKAEKILELAANNAPLEKNIQYHLAKVYSKSGKQQQAIDILKEILQGETYFMEQKNALALQQQLN